MPVDPVATLRLRRPIRYIGLHSDGEFIIVYPPSNKALTRIVAKTFPEARYARFGHTPDATEAYYYKVAESEGLHTRLEAFAQSERFEFTDIARARVDAALMSAQADRALAGAIVPTKKIDVPDLRETLRDYQLAALEYGESRSRVYFADDMGLGKTVTSMCWVRMKDAYPSLVVPPANARTNWKNEFEKFFGDALKVKVLYGRPQAGEGVALTDWLKGSGRRVVICSYNALDYWVQYLTFQPLGSIVLDEAHYIRKMSANRTRNAIRIAENVPHRAFLSGTPVEKTSADLRSQLTAAGVIDLFQGYPSLDGKGTDADDLALNRRLAEVLMVRRRKTDVSLQLPEKDVQWMALDIDEEDLRTYARAEDEFIEWVKTHEGADLKLPMGTLREMVGVAKIPSIIEWLEPLWKTDAVPLIFCYHHKVIEGVSVALEKKGIKTIRYHGKMSPRAKDDALKLFQDGGGRCMVAQIGAAGIALNIQRADNVIFTELDWLPTTHAQAESRAHRQGSKHERVDVRYLFAPRTLDEDMRGILDQRARNIGIVVDGEDVGAKATLENMLKRRKEK